MHIEEFTCEQFRNIEKARIQPGSNINVIYGENAQGKTNFIEALWMFTGLKSFRGAKDQELRMFGSEQARASLIFYSQERTQKAELVVQKNRQLKLGGIPVERPVKMAECFPAVVFSPAHLMMVKGPPAERRRFLDTAVAQMRPRYAVQLQEYMRAMDQRNALLRDVKRHTDLWDLLDLFENRMAQAAEPVIEYRQRYCKALAETAPAVYDGLSGGREHLEIKYSYLGGQPVKEQMRKELKASRDSDIKTGVTSVGPHRDDLILEIAGQSARRFGSQGQQRSAVLSLKIAEAVLLERFSGEKPVALLDDVMSELDAGRQDYILNHIDNWQVFITCCEPETVGRMAQGTRFFMQAGTIQKV